MEQQLDEREFGPGSDVTWIERIAADSLLVVDRATNRVSLLDEPSGATRDLALPPGLIVRDARVMRWPDRVIALAARGSEREILLLRASGDRIVIDGAVPLHARHSLKLPNIVTLGNAADGSVWFAQSRPGTLTRIAADDSRKRFSWRPDWTRAYVFPGSADPHIAAVHEDAHGDLWLYWRVPTPAAGPALIAAAQGTPLEERRHLYHTVVEVVDPANRRVRARGYIAAALVNLLPDGRAVLQRRSPAGQFAAGVYRFSID